MKKTNKTDEPRRPVPRFEQFVERLESAVNLEDLSLPESGRRRLQEILKHIKLRASESGPFPYCDKTSQEAGVIALFAGPDGPGKTLAAKALANDLNLPLYRVDLSRIVSKYIGETEKNLQRLFDSADERGAVLLFDEADALFGKRSEVQDSHDRYANQEVSHLLQRMESFLGLVILSSNMKSDLDHTFLAHIGFAIEFPFPTDSRSDERVRSPE